MSYRIPNAWDADQQPTRLPDTDPSPHGATGGGCGVPGAEGLALLVPTDPDPARSRRGARGAAAEIHRESQTRGWGMSPQQCRARANKARATCANKRD